MFSYHNIQLKLLEGRLHLLTTQVDSSQNVYEQAEALKENFSNQLVLAKTTLIDLEERYKTKREAIELKEQALNNVASGFRDLQNQVLKATDDMEQAKSAKEEKETWLNNVKTQMQFYQQDIDLVIQEMQPYNQIINSPGPTPRYDYYCKNGHHNCPNLPNDQQTLLNQSEIDQYNQKVEQAKKNREKLLKEKARLEDAYSELAKQSEELQEKATAATQDYNNCLNVLNKLQRKLETSKQLEQQVRFELEGLHDESKDLSYQISVVRNEIYTLTGDLERAKSAAEKAKATWIMLESQLQQLKDQYQALQENVDQEERKAKLYELAYQEQNEQSALEQSIPSQSDEPPPLSRAEQIMLLAKQEVEEGERIMKEAKEKIQQKASDIITTVGDFWPNPSIAILKATGQVMDEIVEKPSEQTGNLIIDAATAERRNNLSK